MAFANKLDTNVVTITPSTEVPGTFEYVTSQATIELNDVNAYYTYVALDGSSTTYTFVNMVSGGGLIIDTPYATIDNLLNP